MPRLALLAALASLLACHHAATPAPDANIGPTASEPVQHFLHAAFALRDAARTNPNASLATHAEIPWLRTHLAWDLLSTLAASHGLAEAPTSTALEAWPAAIDQASQPDSTPTNVADSVRSIGETAGSEPCLFRSPTASESAFITGFLTYDPLPAGLDPSIGARLGVFRTLAAQVGQFVVARCTRGVRPIAVGLVMEQGAPRLVPIVIQETPVR